MQVIGLSTNLISPMEWWLDMDGVENREELGWARMVGANARRGASIAVALCNRLRFVSLVELVGVLYRATTCRIMGPVS